MRTLFLLPALLLVGSLATVILQAHATPDPLASTPPRTIVIGIDLSSSNPLIHDDAFAANVGARVGPMIAGLVPHSRVVLRSFGAYNSSANSPLTLDILIAPKSARADDVAKLVSGVIAGVPKLVRDGRISVQNATNIVPFLQNVSRVVTCSAMPTVVILVSDGIEDSQVANLKRRAATLPSPGPIFAGCEELTILGIGRGLNSPFDTERLRTEWSNWAHAAGFKTFNGLNDW